MRPTRWRAFFGDYRNLTVGTLYALGEGPQAYANIVSDFEVVDARYYDLLREENEALKKQIEDFELLRAERDRMKAALEKIANLSGLEVRKENQPREIAREALRGNK
jgi:hypothetical protein